MNTSAKSKYSVGGGKYAVGEETETGGIVKNPFPKSIGSKIDESKDMVQISKERKMAEEIKAKKRKNPLKDSRGFNTSTIDSQGMMTTTMALHK